MNYGKDMGMCLQFNPGWVESNPFVWPSEYDSSSLKSLCVCIVYRSVMAQIIIAIAIEDTLFNVLIISRNHYAIGSPLSPPLVFLVAFCVFDLWLIVTLVTRPAVLLHVRFQPHARLTPTESRLLMPCDVGERFE